MVKIIIIMFSSLLSNGGDWSKGIDFGQEKELGEVGAEIFRFTNL